MNSSPDYKEIFSGCEATSADVNYGQLIGAYSGSLASGAALLKEIEQFICSYIVLPEGSSLALSAWIFVTHCFDSFDVFPYLAITSPVPACGKATCLI